VITYILPSFWGQDVVMTRHGLATKQQENRVVAQTDLD